MEQVYFGYDDDIINPCWDNVFKAVFTKETPESRGALQNLLSAIIGFDLEVTEIVANEPAVDNKNERQIRYDISCTLSDGTLCNIEMTLNPRDYEPVRLEYYVSKRFVSQEIRGTEKTYNDLRPTYQIALIVNKSAFADNMYVHRFLYYDYINSISLGGKTRIITVELSKLDSIAEKQVPDMTPLERWSVFFRYTPDKTKRSLINEIIKSEEGIAMGAQILLNVSKDEAERARLLSEYKYEVDYQSDIESARRETVAKYESILASKDAELESIKAENAKLLARLNALQEPK